jgi:hypothetical protein
MKVTVGALVRGRGVGVAGKGEAIWTIAVGSPVTVGRTTVGIAVLLASAD